MDALPTIATRHATVFLAVEGTTLISLKLDFLMGNNHLTAPASRMTTFSCTCRFLNIFAEHGVANSM